MNLKFGPAQIYWKRLADFWGLLALSLFTLDFFSNHRYKAAATACAIIYIAILGIFIGEKEYFRWKNIYVSKFFGEGFIILWTIVLATLIIVSAVSKKYGLPEEMSVAYISILTFYFASLRSKQLKKMRLAKKY